jgi:uncharacterized protein YbjT (DUF2867 family)
MKILVIGGTGTVGSGVVQQLIKNGDSVRVLSSSPEKIISLPTGAEGVVGNLEKEETLPAALDGAEGVFLLNALAQSETQQGLNVVNAAKEANIQRMVYMSVARINEGKQIPHFATKIPIEKAVRESGIAYTILRPNNFYQNDYWFKDTIMAYGIYPQPIGSVGISRIDVRDIADAAVSAFSESRHENKVYELGGPEVLTGQGTAAVYSRHLGKSIKYAGDDVDRWGEQAKQTMPSWLVDDLKIMYKYFQKAGLRITAEELKEQEKIVGHTPRTFDSFIGETAALWKS